MSNFDSKDIIKIKDDPKPVRSLVQMYFPDKCQSYTYYNDQYDLHVGDRVWVEGKLEKYIGVVAKVMYNFKIKLSEYKRVISLIDTSVGGELYLGGTHWITFDRYTLSREQIHSWFFPPYREDEEEYVVGGDDSTSFSLDDPLSLLVDVKTFERGCHYYNDDRVKYICVDSGHGYTIIRGSEYYEVEFELVDRMVSNLVCTCMCTDTCKHEVAVLLQLKETLDHIVEHYDIWYKGYFTAIDHSTLLCYAVGTKKSGRVVLEV